MLICSSVEDVTKRLDRLSQGYQMKSSCLTLTNSCCSDDNSGSSKGAGGGRMGSWIAGEL